MTRDDVILALRTSLRDGGWPVERAEDAADEPLDLARRLHPGTVVDRRLDEFYVRAVTLNGDAT